MKSKGGLPIAECSDDAGRIDRVLRLALLRSENRTLDPVVWAGIADEVQLPARAYRSAIAALENAGLFITNDDQSDDEPVEGGFDADGLGLFMARTRHRILSAAEEVDLGKRMERGRLARRALSLGAPPDVAPTLEAHVRDGDAAADEMVRHNMRLVVSLAAKAARHGTPALELEDLVQEGYFGLATAVSKWDYTRSLKFSTYATWWIRQTMSRALADKAHTIRLPVHARDSLARLLRIERQVLSEGKTPTTADIAQRAGMKSTQAKALLTWRHGIDSLHRFVAGSETQLHELLVDERASEPELLAVERTLRDEIHRLLTCLGPKESEIIRRRFGIGNAIPETLEEIGGSFGVTRERVRQIEGKALETLRHPTRSGHLRSYLGGE